MARISNLNCLVATLLVVFVVSGCQSSSKWMASWNEPAKPKFKGLEDNEKVTYWPYKPDKSKQKMTALPSQLKDKLAKKTDQSKRDAQLVDLIKEGDQLRKNGQLEDARIVYTKALGVSPESADVHHRLAIIADKQFQYTIADEHYQAALKVRPRDVNLLSDLGWSYSLRGNPRQAEQTLKLALEIDRSHRGAMLNLGYIYSKQDRRQEALAVFRAGATETEAQQYFAQLFPVDRSGPGNGVVPEMGHSNNGPAIASTTNDPPPDLSKLSFEQIQTEMQRRAQEAKRRRAEADQKEFAQARHFSAGEELSQQQQFQQPQQQLPQGQAQARLLQGGQSNQGRNQFGGPVSVGPPTGDDWANSNVPPGIETAQRQPGTGFTPGFNPQNQTGAATSRSAPTIGNFRGLAGQLQPGIPIETQIQQSQYQQPPGTGMNNAQPVDNASHASQMATQLGMSAGPGSMFPIVAGSNNDSGAAAAPAGSSDNRFGGEFQQPPSYQQSQNWSGNPTIQPSQTPGSSGAQIEGIPSIGPGSPTNNWGSPTTGGGLNWQNGTSNSSNWANSDLPGSGAAGTGLDSGAGQLLRTQNADQRGDAQDRFGSSTNSVPRLRNGNDTSKPYNGAWPNSNSLPMRQNQSGPGNDTMSINPLNGGGPTIPSSQNGAASNSSSNSLPLWPSAPNR